MMVARIVLGIVVLAAGILAVISARSFLVGPPALARVSPTRDLDLDATSAATRLAGAIRFPTVSLAPDAPPPADALVEFHGFMIRSFPRLHERLERETIGQHSLLYTWRGSDPALEPILFAAHLDVAPVEPGTEQSWSHPPFGGVIADGYVWGRGAMDMKASVMGILEAVEHLLGKGFTPTRTVYLAFGHDEETGGRNGAFKIARLLAERGIRLRFTLDEGLVITDGIVPGVARPAALIGVAEKGVVTLELTARGQGGHSSMPPVKSAVGGLVLAIQRLQSNQMPAALESPAADMFEYLAPEMPFLTRAVIANRWLFESLLLTKLAKQPSTNALIRTTTAPTMIAGGIKPNVVPTMAKATVNFRILPGDTVEAVLEHVRSTIDDPEIEIRQVGGAPSDPSTVSDINSESFKALWQTIRQVFPDAVVAPGLVPGRTDSRHYDSIAESSFRFQPLRLVRGDLKRFHGIDERIAVQNYMEIIHFHARLIRNTTGR